MKKVVYIMALAVTMLASACNGNTGGSSAPADTMGNISMSNASNTEDAALNIPTNGDQMSGASGEVVQGDNQSAALPAPPKPAFTPEEAEKYKDAIGLIKNYSEEVNKCVDAKMNGKAIDETVKQRITDIQTKLADLEKNGKMNQKLIELKKVSDDVYNKILAK